MGIPIISGAAKIIYDIRVPVELRNARRTRDNAIRRLRKSDIECGRLKTKRATEAQRADERVRLLEMQIERFRRNPSLERVSRIPVLGAPVGLARAAARGIYVVRRPSALRAVDRMAKLQRENLKNIDREINRLEKEDYKRNTSRTPYEIAIRSAQYAKLILSKEQVERDMAAMNSRRQEMEDREHPIAAARIGNNNPMTYMNPIRDGGLVEYGPQDMSPALDDALYNDLNTRPNTTAYGPLPGSKIYHMDSNYEVGDVVQNPKRGMNAWMRFLQKERGKYPKAHTLKENAAIVKKIAVDYHRINGGGARSNPNIEIGLPIPFTGGIKKKNARTAFMATAALLAVYLINKVNMGKKLF